MKSPGRALHWARKQVGASPAEMAELLCVEEAAWVAAESDQHPLDTSILALCARLLGLSVRELLGEHASPPLLFYRQAQESAAVRNVLQHGTGLILGELVRDLRLAMQLDVAASPQLPTWASPQPLPDGSMTPHGAEELARRVRGELGLGLEPIPSMWALARDCGVRCAAVTPEVLDRSIDGFSWRQERPGVVVNLIGGASEWWRTRMTLAHELAHVWFDDPALGLVISTEPRSGALYSYFRDIEQRANAFAAYLLVPPERVRYWAQRYDLGGDLMRAVATECGVGFQTAVHTVCNVLGTSRPARLRLLTEPHPWMPEAVDHPDARVPPAPREQLHEAVGRALREERLDSVRARLLLGLRMSDPLPPGLPDSGPVLGTLRRVQNAAARRLHAEGRHDVVPDRVELLPDGSYRVTLVEARYGAKQGVAAGELVLPASVAA